MLYLIQFFYQIGQVLLYLKLVSVIFYEIFIFHQMDSPFKITKKVCASLHYRLLLVEDVVIYTQVLLVSNRFPT